MYFASVLLLMLILPLASIFAHAIRFGQNLVKFVVRIHAGPTRTAGALPRSIDSICSGLPGAARLNQSTSAFWLRLCSVAYI
jgi:hypothetical protein